MRHCSRATRSLSAGLLLALAFVTCLVNPDVTQASVIPNGTTAVAAATSSDPFPSLDTNSDSDWNIAFGPAGSDRGDVFVRAAVVYRGNLIVAGNFKHINGLLSDKIAMWDGDKWVSTGASVNTAVMALTVYNDYLIAAGDFTTSTSRIMKWNGVSWTSLSSNPTINGTINALAVYDNDLYAGGAFTSIGSTGHNRIAKWDSTNGWMSVSSGTSGEVKCLATHGGNLYVGGAFLQAGGVNVSTQSGSGFGNIVAWNGTSWSYLDDAVNGSVNALIEFDGSLKVGGQFTQAKNTGTSAFSANRVATYAGGWSTLGGGTAISGSTIDAFGVWNSTLYAGGSFSVSATGADNLAKLDTDTWTPFPGGDPGAQVYAICPFESNAELFVGGNFSNAGSLAVEDMAKTTGSSWTTFGHGIGHASGVLIRSLYLDGGNLIAGGEMHSAGATTVNDIAQWTGAIWQTLDSGLGGGAGGQQVYAIAKAGSDVLAGGTFTTPKCIAKYSGGTWSALSTPLTTASSVRALLEVGGGVLVGGQFTSPYDNSDNIALWTGSAWMPYGSFTGFSGPPVVVALTGHDGTTYAAAGNAVYKYNGSSWSRLGQAFNNQVNALTSYAGNLVIGGAFTDTAIAVTGNSFKHVAKWTGAAWQQVGVGLAAGDVQGLATYHCNLIATGDFTQDGSSTEMSGIARWNGSTWTAMGSTTTKGINDDGYALAVDGHTLWVGGSFWKAGNKPSSYIAKYSETYSGIEQVDLTATTGRTSIRLDWPTPGPGSPACGPVTYKLVMDDSPITESSFASLDALDAGPTDVYDTPHCFLLDDLDNCHWYYFGIKVTDAGGFTSPLESISARTLCSGFMEVTDCGSLFGNPDEMRREDIPLDLLVTPIASDGVSITLSIPHELAGQVGSLAVYNVLGRRVRTIKNDVFTAGTEAVTWGHIDDAGRSVGAGIYFARLTIGDVRLTKRILVLR